jgi:hypothetical protein
MPLIYQSPQREQILLEVADREFSDLVAETVVFPPAVVAVVANLD